MRKEIIHIKGMHCSSCELLLEKNLKKIKNIKNCEVSHIKGITKIEYKSQLPIDEIKRVVKDLGYEVVQSHEQKNKESHENTFDDYMEIIIIFLLIGVVIYFLKELELTRFFPKFNANANVLIALLIGLVASVSTCLAITGGIVMSFGTKYHDKSKIIPHFYFHVGRIGGFSFLGGLLGSLGSKINYSTTFTGYLTIFVGAVMLYIGLQILNIVPNITKLGFRLPKFLSRKIHSLEGNDHHFTPIIIGILTFFLPCGFTQSMQLAAVASQSFISGALIMGAFALGTMPVLLSIGIGSSYTQEKKFNSFKKFVGVIIIFFAIYSFNSGLILSKSRFTLSGLLSNNSNIQTVGIQNNIQVVNMDVDWSFKPNVFKIKKGIPVRWEIEGINITGCSNEIIVPKYNIRKTIQKGKNIIEFTPTETGTIPFSCWMGMIGGKFIVTN